MLAFKAAAKIKDCRIVDQKCGVLAPACQCSDLTISNALALCEVTLAGLGPALLVDWLVRDHLASKELVDLFPRHLVTPTQFHSGVWLVYPSRTFLAQKVRVALDFFREHLGRGQV